MAGAIDRDVARARMAFQRVSKSSTKVDSGKYQSALQQLPAMLQTHGFGQTMAFHMAKGNSEGGKHLDQTWRDLLEGVVAGSQDLVGRPQDRGDVKKVADWLTKRDSREHRILLTEALAYAGWLKRWAEALIQNGGTKSTANAKDGPGRGADAAEPEASAPVRDTGVGGAPVSHEVQEPMEEGENDGAEAPA